MRRQTLYGVLPSTIDETLYDAFGQRQVASFSSQTDTFRVILEVLPDLQRDIATLDRLSVRASNGNACPAFGRGEVDDGWHLAVINRASGPIAGCDHLVQPGAQCRSGERHCRHRKCRVQHASSGRRCKRHTPVAQRPSRIRLGPSPAHPGIARRRLHHSGRALRKPYPSADDPVDLAIGRTSAHFLRCKCSWLRLWARRDDWVILLIGIVKKNGIMLVDFAIQAEGGGGLSSEEAIVQSRPDAFPTDPDDHDGRVAGWNTACSWPRFWRRTTPAARYAIVGGLMVSQVLTLYTTPVIYLLLDKLRRRKDEREGKLVPA